MVMRLTQYTSLTGPVDVPPPPSTDGGAPWLRASQLRQYQAVAGPVEAPNTITGAPSNAIYPNRLARLRGLHASHHPSFFIDRFDAPTPVTAPDIVAVMPQIPVRRKPSSALYQPAHPMFGVQVDVPVMSWTGHYPDRLPHWHRRMHASRMPSLFWDTVLFPDVVVAPDLAYAVFPDRLKRAGRPVEFPQVFAPLVVADVTTTAPALSWKPIYPDRLYALRGTRPSQHPSFFLHAEPVPVIAVSHLSGGRGYYVVPGRPRKFIVPPHKRTFSVM